MNALIPTAHAAAEAPTQGSSLHMIMMLVVFGLIFYFMIYRPQASRTKAHRNLLASLAKGDEVLTSGGLMGRITKIFEENGCLLLALNTHLEVVLKKEFITEVLPKGTLKSL